MIVYSKARRQMILERKFVRSVRIARAQMSSAIIVFKIGSDLNAKE